MSKKIVIALAALALFAAGLWLRDWYGSGPLDKDTAFVVPDGSTLTSVATKLEREQAIASAASFLTRAKILRLCPDQGGRIPASGACQQRHDPRSAPVGQGPAAAGGSARGDAFDHGVGPADGATAPDRLDPGARRWIDLAQ